MLTIDGGNKVKINGEENITRYESSEWAARAFCQNCGTHLYYQMNDTGQYYLPAGLFEGVEKLTFDHQIFIDQKPDNYAFANDTFNMTGEEVFAAFASQDGE